MLNGGLSNQSNCPSVEAAGATTVLKFNLGYATVMSLHAVFRCEPTANNQR